MSQERAAGTRITSTAMKDWQWSSGNTLELWERKAIKLLDTAFLTRGSELDDSEA